MVFEDPVGAELTDPDGFSDDGFFFIHGPDNSGFLHLHWGMNATPPWPDSETNIVLPHGDMIMTSLDGSPFGLVSVDLAGSAPEKTPFT